VATVTCPACEARFNSSLMECPKCGRSRRDRGQASSSPTEPAWERTFKKGCFGTGCGCGVLALLAVLISAIVGTPDRTQAPSAPQSGSTIRVTASTQQPAGTQRGQAPPPAAVNLGPGGWLNSAEEGTSDENVAMVLKAAVRTAGCSLCLPRLAYTLAVSELARDAYQGSPIDGAYRDAAG